MQRGVGRNPLEMRTYSFRSSKSGLKGRLSVLYLSWRFSVYLSCPGNQRTRGQPSSSPRAKAFATEAELQRRTVAAFVLHLAAERSRRHWFHPPGSPCLIPGVCVSSHPQPRQPGAFESTGGRGGRPGPRDAICIRSASRRRACPAH